MECFSTTLSQPDRFICNRDVTGTYHSNMNTSIYYYCFIITVSYSILFCLPGNTDSSSRMDVMFSADDSANMKHLN